MRVKPRLSAMNKTRFQNSARNYKESQVLRIEPQPKVVKPVEKQYQILKIKW